MQIKLRVDLLEVSYFIWLNKITKISEAACSWKTTDCSEVIVGRNTMVTASLDIESGQIDGKH